MRTQARAEALAYLVINQAIARRVTGQWMGARNLAQTIHVWQKYQATILDWRDRTRLGQHSEVLADLFCEELAKWTTRDLADAIRRELRSGEICFAAVTQLCSNNLPAEYVPPAP